MYFFKKLVGTLLAPLTFALLLAALGLLLRWRGRHRAATVVFSCAALFAWLIATPLVGGWLLAPLERQYPAQAAYPAVRHVVVLGSSYAPAAETPVTAAIDDAGLRRIVEGIRIQRQIPGAELVVSGGSPYAGDAPAAGNALLARSLGLSPDRVTMLDRPLDTRGEAAEIVAHTRGEPFILVTTAAHMPRAMEYMRRAGGHPIAAPTGQRVRRGFLISCLVPGPSGLQMSEDALHEYLGWLALIADLG